MQYTAQGRAWAIEPRGTAQVDQAQRLCPGISRLVDQHAASLHQDPHFNEKVRRYGTAAQQQAKQRGQKAFRHFIILIAVC
ncbi:hypothetical protein PAGU2196_09720 [Pseudomonas sp. PAGU 2196]|nr:hypothetical protein PAGU2196_09720 [Pseudomonas sp. PAGU 2196]